MVSRLIPEFSGASDLSAILSEQAVRFAYLFGSRADGTSTECSDIDLALYFGDGTPTMRFDRASAIQRRLQSLVRAPVDVVVLDDGTPVLRFEAIKPAQVVYEDDETFRLNTELTWIREYEDYAYRLREHMKLVAEGLRELRP